MGRLIRAADRTAWPVRASGYPLPRRKQKISVRHDPRHPGGAVRRQWLEPLGLTVTLACEGLDILRQAARKC